MRKNTIEKVLILLVEFNTVELIPGVLESIQEDEIDVSILLVANGSSNESYAHLKMIDDPRVHLIRSEENLGFAGGNNFGLKYAMENLGDFRYVFLLNTDAFLEPNLIGGMVKILDKEEKAACISPKIFDKNGSLWYGGSTLDTKKGKVVNLYPIDERKRQIAYDVDAFNGCAVLFRIDRFIEAGLLNEKLFLYYEEADCSMRLKELGYRILYAPQFTVLHDVSYSSRSFSFLKTYYMTRNRFLVFNDTMTIQSKIYFILYQSAFFLKNRQYKNTMYLFKGILDYMKGKTGKLANQAGVLAFVSFSLQLSAGII